jgi:hypothetical protein
VEDQLEVGGLADQQPVNQKAAKRLRAAPHKPGSSNSLTSVSVGSGQQSFLHNRSILFGGGDRP